jgi:hypothetical protein
LYSSSIPTLRELITSLKLDLAAEEQKCKLFECLTSSETCSGQYLEVWSSARGNAAVLARFLASEAAVKKCS